MLGEARADEQPGAEQREEDGFDVVHFCAAVGLSWPGLLLLLQPVKMCSLCWHAVQRSI